MGWAKGNKQTHTVKATVSMRDLLNALEIQAPGQITIVATVGENVYELRRGWDDEFEVNFEVVDQKWDWYR